MSTIYKGQRELKNLDGRQVRAKNWPSQNKSKNYKNPIKNKKSHILINPIINLTSIEVRFDKIPFNIAVQILLSKPKVASPIF